MASRSRSRSGSSAGGRTSPYAAPLARALAGGTPFDAAIVAIARRRGRSPRQVLESLRSAGLSRVQRIAGEDVDLPTPEAFEGVPRAGRSADAARAAEAAAWRSIASWLVASGAMTAESLAAAAGSRRTFLEAVGDAVASGLLDRAGAPAGRATPEPAAAAATTSAPGAAAARPRGRLAPAAAESRDERLHRIRTRGLTARKRRAA